MAATSYSRDIHVTPLIGVEAHLVRSRASSGRGYSLPLAQHYHMGLLAETICTISRLTLSPDMRTACRSSPLWAAAHFMHPRCRKSSTLTVACFRCFLS